MFPREDTLQPIARIVKAYGTEGEVMVSFPDGMSDILKTDEPVWLFYDGLPVPFFIQTIQFKGPRKAIVRLEDIDTLADAEEAAGKELYIDPADYPELNVADGHPLTEDGLTLEDLIGFTLLDQDSRTAGVISDPATSVSDLREQTLLSPITTTCSWTSIPTTAPSPSASPTACSDPALLQHNAE